MDIPYHHITIYDIPHFQTNCICLEVKPSTESCVQEQERRFRVAVCQSTGAILCAVLPSSDMPQAEIYAYHAVLWRSCRCSRHFRGIRIPSPQCETPIKHDLARDLYILDHVGGVEYSGDGITHRFRLRHCMIGIRWLS